MMISLSWQQHLHGVTLCTVHLSRPYYLISHPSARYFDITLSCHATVILYNFFPYLFLYMYVIKWGFLIIHPMHPIFQVVLTISTFAFNVQVLCLKL